MTEINKLQDGTIMITFKHPSQVLFNKGTILTIGRNRCCDRLLKCPPSQINLNSQVGAYRRAFSNNTKHKKRQKNIIKSDELCCGLRANGERCTRRKKNGHEKFCGTHVKGTPHGEVDHISMKPIHTKKTVWAQDIKGTIYYIDDTNNVYDPQDVIENKTNPKIIAKYKKEGDVYSIPSIFKK